MTGKGVLTAQSYEADLEAPTRLLQREARRLVEASSPLPAVGSSAKATLLVFLAEYHRYRLGQHGASTRVSRGAVEEFESGFVLLPPDPSTSLDTWIGNGETYPERTEAPVVRSVQRRFELQAYPVTNSLYALFDAGHPKRFGDYSQYSPDPLCPVGGLTWYDSVVFSWWSGGTLPTEIEWEYACRAAPGKDAKRMEYCFGNDTNQLGGYAWYSKNSGDRTHSVRSENAEEQKSGNVWGLYHMHGNVWEWCRNWYADSVPIDFERQAMGKYRSVRGGSFNDDPELCRSACRLWGDAAHPGPGVRVSRAASD